MAVSYVEKKQKILNVDYLNPIPIKGPILLVDDIADSGDTLQTVKDKLTVWHKEVTTLTLIYKTHSIIKPDYYYEKRINKQWVIFPWE